MKPLDPVNAVPVKPLDVSPAALVELSKPSVSVDVPSRDSEDYTRTAYDIMTKDYKGKEAVVVTTANGRVSVPTSQAPSYTVRVPIKRRDTIDEKSLSNLSRLHSNEISESAKYKPGAVTEALQSRTLGGEDSVRAQVTSQLLNLDKTIDSPFRDYAAADHQRLTAYRKQMIISDCEFLFLSLD